MKIKITHDNGTVLRIDLPSAAVDTLMGHISSAMSFIASTAPSFFQQGFQQGQADAAAEAAANTPPKKTKASPRKPKP